MSDRKRKAPISGKKKLKTKQEDLVISILFVWVFWSHVLVFII